MDILASRECMSPHSRPIIGLRWSLSSPLLSAIGCIVHKVRFLCAWEATAWISFLEFEPQESVAYNILGAQTNSRRRFQYIIVIADRFTCLVKIAPWNRIGWVDVAYEFLVHWDFQYGPPKKLLPELKSSFHLNSSRVYIRYSRSLTISLVHFTNRPMDR